MKTLKTIITALLVTIPIFAYSQNASEKKALKKIEKVYEGMPGIFDKTSYENGVLTLIFTPYSKVSIDIKQVKEFTIHKSDLMGYQIYYRTKQNETEWVHFESYRKEKDAENVKDELDVLRYNL